MPSDRYYCPSIPVPNNEAYLKGQELHHLNHVSRSKEGDLVELIDGNGTFAHAEVIKLKRSIATLKILSSDTQSPSPFTIVLAQAIARPNRLDTIVEKATELGVTELWLFPGKLSEKNEIKDNQLERLQKIAISATKQSGRLFLPKIKKIDPLEQWSSNPFPLFYGDVNPDAPTLLNDWNSSPPSKGIIFCIGPESGFNPEEEISLKTLNARGVKLHNNILRTDTAPIAALAVIAQLQ